MNKKDWANNAYRNSHGFNRSQCVKGGKARWSMPVDPSMQQRIWPPLPNTWFASAIWVNRTLGTWMQYDLIAKRNHRSFACMLNGVEMPIGNNTELFANMRELASMEILEE